MRVVHLTTEHSPQDVRIFLKECRTLAAAGHEVHCLAPGADAAVVEGVHLHPIDRPRSRSRLLRTYGRWSSAYRTARALRADLYHFHDPDLILVGLLLKRTGAKVVYDVHELAPEEVLTMTRGRPIYGRLKSWSYRLLELLARRKLDGFVCAWPAIHKRFPPERSILLENYPLLAEFPRPAELAASAPYANRANRVVYAGGLLAVRGVREMVRAVGRVPARYDCRLALIGRISPPDLLDEIRALPGWQRVEYLGWLTRDRMIQELGRCRAGLVLYHPERDHVLAVPNKMYEYLAASLPIVASDFPVWRERVAQEGFGLCVNPHDPRGIAGAICYLLDHQEEGEEMGRRGRVAQAAGLLQVPGVHVRLVAIVGARPSKASLTCWFMIAEVL
jgi:glycosyltransferase involved in cell wall biosynthesis